MLVLNDNVKYDDLEKYGFVRVEKLKEEFCKSYFEVTMINYSNGCFFKSTDGSGYFDGYGKILQQYMVGTYKWQGSLLGGKSVLISNDFIENQTFKKFYSVNENNGREFWSNIADDYIYDMIKDGILIKVDDDKYCKKLEEKNKIRNSKFYIGDED